MNKTERALQLIRTAKQAVIEEINHNTGTVSTITQLIKIKQELEAMEHSICNASIPPKSSRDRGMGRMISDSWPLESKLGEMILSAEEAYIRL